MKEKSKESTINLDKNKRERERKKKKETLEQIYPRYTAAGRRVNTKNQLKNSERARLTVIHLCDSETGAK